MADPIFRLTGTELDGKTPVIGENDVLLADALTYITAIRKRVVTLIDAQIKLLPTVPVEIVAAAPAGYRNKILGLTVLADTTGGAYGSLNASYCDLHVINGGGGYVIYGLVDDTTPSPALTQLTDLLAVTDKRLYDLLPPLSGWGVSGPTFPSYVLPGGFHYRVDEVAGNLMIGIDNNGSGNLSLGHSANTLKVTTYYLHEAV